jgi:uncharacterized DUF497 family protein
VKIEFDHAKREATLDNRGLDMARAAEIFVGAALTIADERAETMASRASSRSVASTAAWS